MPGSGFNWHRIHQQRLAERDPDVDLDSSAHDAYLRQRRSNELESRVRQQPGGVEFVLRIQRLGRRPLEMD